MREKFKIPYCRLILVRGVVGGFPVTSIIDDVLACSECHPKKLPLLLNNPHLPSI
jgi:hypothetical protein